LIAIFDIGKTNKKFFIFDEEYNIVYETSAHLPEISDEDGDACEDVHALTRWIKDTFHDLNSRAEFDISHINFSAYGASLVHVGENGEVVAPLYNYLKPYPEDLKLEFYRANGGEIAFAQATASPVLGSLNSGMMLYLLKHRKPNIFERIKFSIHLPQYVSSLFTSEYCSDLTSIGCHTNLWDFTARRYHPWVESEGIGRKLPPIFTSNKIFEIRVGRNIMYSGIGLHDSSSALIPYLESSKEPFVLLSTGTWCISLNPFNNSPLTAAELSRDCLSYLSFRGKPVKASRAFLGPIHEEKTKELTMQFGAGEEFDRAYIQLIKELIQEQVKSTDLVMQGNIKNLYVDGGFSQNKIFMKLLAEAYPKLNVYASSMTQASALGAAMAIRPASNYQIKLVSYSGDTR
jgi:sugar (pentulose or hexulose) kinase